MIYLFAGNDTKKKRSAYEKFSESLGNLESFTFIKNDFSREQAESFYSGAGLFFEKCAVFFDHVFEDGDAKEFLLAHLPDMAQSANIFVFLERELSKTEVDAFKKARAEVNIFELPKEKLEKYDNFLLANAFGARDKFNLWAHYVRATSLGVSLEELSGVLFWKAKDMILKKNFSKFSETELQNFSAKLAILLPKTRGERLDDEASFEKFLLEAF